MCGICGVVRTRTSPRIEEAQLVRMRDTLVHRGPDAMGSYIDEFAALGHRRLSIVDVVHGQQPMRDMSDRYVLVYNGEIYNHPSLKVKLEADGTAYRTNCDTESVLHLFERYGDNAPRYMRGMFAIAVWDRVERRLVLARDRFGVKPLYYLHRDDGSLAFASEIKALINGGLARPAVNEHVLSDYLANRAPSGDETLFAGIRRLSPGHTLSWQDGNVIIRKYWDLRDSFQNVTTGTSEKGVVDEYRFRLTEAVRIRLMADVPLGVFLSGGIDSAAITALMSSIVEQPVKTFSVAFAEREANELYYARLVANHFKTDHHEVIVTPAQFFESLPKLVWHEDEPIAHPSSVALNFVSRLASEHAKVVLTGEGSDEMLAGYNKYRVTVFNSQFGSIYSRYTPRFIRRALRSTLTGLPQGLGFRQKMERSFMMRHPTIEDLYLDNFAVFSKAQQLSLLSPHVREMVLGSDAYQAFYSAMDNAGTDDLLGRLLYADTKTYLHELLMKQDQMSMAASIESRVPFLDHTLAEWVTSLPNRFKLRGTTTKWLLRAAMKQILPSEILSRRKMGFPVPFASWVRGPWVGVMRDVILSERSTSRRWFDTGSLTTLIDEHSSGRYNHSERLWMLMNFEIWQRIFIDGEDHETISYGIMSCFRGDRR